MNNLNLTITSETGNFFKVQNFTEKLMRDFTISEKLYGKLDLAILEALKNAVIHGNKSNPKKIITIKAWVEDDNIFVSVEDEGEGFDYTFIPDPTLPENLMKVSGRGLYLMKTLSDNLEFQNNGSKVIMSFSLKS